MTYTSNIQRIVQILSVFDDRNHPLTARELIDRTAIARSTGFALLNALAKRGFLEKTEAGYVLGPSSRKLSFASTDPVSDRSSLRAASQKRSSAPEGLKLNPLLFERVTGVPSLISPPWKIGFANASLSNPWRVALETNLVERCDRLAPWVSELLVRNADDDADKQAGQIEDMISMGVDALVVSVSPKPGRKLTTILRRCMERGLPVVALDRRPRSHNSYTTFVTASDDMIGRLSAIWLSERLGGKGTLWLLSGVHGSSPAHRRLNAASSVFTKFPGITIAAHRYTDWTSEGGYRAIEGLLESETSAPDGIWCDSGLQGVGSIEAFIRAGLPIPPHTGGDVNGIYKSAIENRVSLCAIDYPAAMGGKAIEVAIALLKGETITRRIEVPTPVILTRGDETSSVKADMWAADHVEWDLPDEALLS